jgi:hypothetical protein
MAETTAATETAEQDLREDQQPQGLPEGDDGQVKDLGDQCIPQQHDDGAEGEYAQDGKEKEARKFCSAKTSHGIYFLMFNDFFIEAFQSLAKVEDRISFPGDEGIHLFSGDLSDLLEGKTIHLMP